MALPYDYGPQVGPGGISAITREPSDYPAPAPGGGWQGPIGPGGVSPGPGDYGGFGGFDSFLPMSFGSGGGGMGDFRPDFAFGGMSQDPRQRLRLGMPRQPFSSGSFVQNRQSAAPMMGFNPAARGLRAPSAPTGGGGLMSPGGRTAAPGGGNPPRIGPGQFAPPQGQNDWVMQGGPWATIQELLKYGFLGPGSSGQEGFGGVFGVNPPSEIMGGVRQRAIQDAGAQERAARLGLQSRGDIDPSTYGFQTLQSQLQGQQGTQRALGEADLGLRQQQLENYWRLLNSLLGAYGGIETAKYGQPKKQGGLGGVLGGIGGLLGGISGLGGGGGGGGGGLYENSGGRYI